MKVNFEFDYKSLNAFNIKCQAAIRNVGRGTKKATTEACLEILEASLSQVPKDTRTLAMSAFFTVNRRTDTAASTWQYEGVVGYGGNGDPTNPKTGNRASDYMVEVHEDLSVPHRNGKAKFLEDPIREYGETKFARTVFKYASDSLASMSE